MHAIYSDTQNIQKNESKHTEMGAVSQNPIQQQQQQLECGPMPNLMVALPNIGGALCSTPQSLAESHY